MAPAEATFILDASLAYLLARDDLNPSLGGATP